MKISPQLNSVPESVWERNKTELEEWARENAPLEECMIGERSPDPDPLCRDVILVLSAEPLREGLDLGPAEESCITTTVYRADLKLAEPRCKGMSHKELADKNFDCECGVLARYPKELKACARSYRGPVSQAR